MDTEECWLRAEIKLLEQQLILLEDIRKRNIGKEILDTMNLLHKYKNMLEKMNKGEEDAKR